MIIKNKELKAKIMALIVKNKIIVLKSLNFDAEDTKQSIKMKFFMKKIITQYIEPGKNKNFSTFFFFIMIKINEMSDDFI